VNRAWRLLTRAFDLRRACIALLLAGAAAVYANALGAAFQFDDFNVIVDYSAVHSLRAWAEAMPGIRPLLKLSYALNWTIDPAPFGFHLLNIACHLASALLVFGLAQRLLGVAPAAALIAALLFALHPAQTEAVTYVSGRSVALMGLFYLGALHAACAERAIYRAALAPLLFAAALATKETAWTLPLAALLVQRWRGESWREALRQTQPLWLALAAMAIAIAANPAYRRLLQHVFSIRTPWSNAALQVDGWWYLLTQPLLLQSNIDPDLPQSPAFDALWWAKLAALVAAAVLVWRLPSRWLRLALLWFGLHLLPTNSLLPRNDIANDRQLYLALIGPALALAAAWRIRHARWLRAALIASLLMACAVATWQRNRDYRDEISLWEATASASPNKARVWNNLGYAYQLAGDRERALSAYARALALDPHYERARINWLLLSDTAWPESR